MKTFLVEDSAGNFAYIEWESQALPFDMMTSAQTIYNCSTGEFIKNKKRRTISAATAQEWAAHLAVVKYKECGVRGEDVAVGFHVPRGAFEVAFDSKQPQHPLEKSYQFHKQRNQHITYQYSIGPLGRLSSKAFNVEGTQTGRVSSRDTDSSNSALPKPNFRLEEYSQAEGRILARLMAKEQPVFVPFPEGVALSDKAFNNILDKLVQKEVRKENEDQSG